jgi:hypothetical protein
MYLTPDQKAKGRRSFLRTASGGIDPGQLKLEASAPHGISRIEAPDICQQSADGEPENDIDGRVLRYGFHPRRQS